MTSGAYRLSSADQSGYLLERNDHHPSVGPNTIRKIRFQSNSFETQISELQQNKVQFVVPSGPVSIEAHRRLEADPNIKSFLPHVGYSYWFSLNPKSLTFRDISARYWFQDVLHNAHLDFSEVSMFWQSANQLYLPDGFGRPDSKTLAEVWAQIAHSKAKLRPQKIILGVSETFKWTHVIVEKLEILGVKVILKKYKSSNEFEQLLLSHDYDAILVNNDFSDAHLVENLLVTFNHSRPLVVIDQDHHFYRDLAKAVESDDEEKNIATSRRIAIDLLLEGLVAPIAYNRKSFYARSNVDLSGWTELQSDLCFWKVRDNGMSNDGLRDR